MTRKRSIPQALLVTLGLGGAIGGSGAIGETPPLATVEADSALVRWIPAVEHAGSTLVLADPYGRVRNFRFQSGELPAVSLFDAQGGSLDGTYTWELRLTLPRGSDPGRGGGQAPAAAPRVMSGYFTLAGGALVDPNLTEAAEHRLRAAAPGVAVAPDQTVPDDLIVDGKGCIGLGCANNESFLNETLRLKQSVVKLRFEDTSSGAFAGFDWQLSANDVGSGGANRFYLEDLTTGTTPFTIFGGAPNNALYVSALGRVGLGTATPAQAFHLVGGTTPALRLEQTGGTPRVWDLAADATSFRLVDVSNASTVPLRVAAGAPADRLVIAADGTVGIGASPVPVPPYLLQLAGSVFGDALALVRNTNPAGYSGIVFDNHVVETPNNAVAFFFGVDNANSITRLNSVQNFPMVLYTNSAERFRILSGGNIGMGCTNPTSRLVIGAGGGAACTTAPWSSINPGAATFTTSSSRAYKENLDPIKVPSILDTIAQVGVYHYDFIDGPKDRIGLVAEDFHKVFGRGSDKVIQGGEVEMALWLAVQKLIEQNRELAARNEELAANHTELEARLAALEGSRGRADE